MAETPKISLVRGVAEVREQVARARAAGKSIGLVPTMGALHAGHVELIRRCRADSDFVVVSVFVNPTQFGPTEDFTKYPRTLDADLAACELGGADVVFAPLAEAIYPRGTAETTFVDVPGVTARLEGASRPGHFRGVATVVMKLLNLVGPDLAHFGRKDYQQLLVVRRMVADLDVPVRIVGVDTVREADGLAMSSRNRYLNVEERRAAVVLSRALGLAMEATQSGERRADRVRQILVEEIESEGLAKLDYAEVADAETLEPLATLGEGREAVALLAVRVGPARLIDNAILPGTRRDAADAAEK
ncbi:pantoate--beta-alanine ligase [Isosphaeraceae bacterium EP7]